MTLMGTTKVLPTAVGGGFDPLTDITNLHAWYDWSDTGSLTLSGSNITVIGDLGPNNFDVNATQAMQTGGSQNGLNAGTNTSHAGYYTAAGFNLVQPFALWVAFNVSAIDNWDIFLGVDNMGRAALRSNDETNFFGQGATGYGSCATATILYLGVDGSGNMAGIKNSSSLTFGGTTAQDFNGTFNIGSFDEAPNALWCEMIFASSIPSTTVRDDCIDYLNTKWALF